MENTGQGAGEGHIFGCHPRRPPGLRCSPKIDKTTLEGLSNGINRRQRSGMIFGSWQHPLEQLAKLTLWAKLKVQR